MHSAIESVCQMLAVLMLVSGCTGMNGKEFIVWTKDPKNGLRVEAIRDDYRIEIQYMPYPYQEALRGQLVGEQMKDSTLLYFTINIGLSQGDLINTSQLSPEQIAERDYYFAYRFQNDLFVEYEGQRTMCGMLHMEKNVNGKGERTFHVVFEPQQFVSGDFVISMESGYISSVPLRFKIRNSKIPSVTL